MRTCLKVPKISSIDTTGVALGGTGCGCDESIPRLIAWANAYTISFICVFLID